MAELNWTAEAELWVEDIFEFKSMSGTGRQGDQRPRLCSQRSRLTPDSVSADGTSMDTANSRLGISNARPVQGCPQPCCA